MIGLLLMQMTIPDIKDTSARIFVGEDAGRGINMRHSGESCFHSTTETVTSTDAASFLRMKLYINDEPR